MRLPARSHMSSNLRSGGISAFKVISDEMGQVGKLIESQLAGCPDQPGLRGLLGYLGNCRGKMIRPGLVLLAGAGCGEITGTHILTAAVIEIIHNATLLHDDVIDEGRKRRGLATVNSLWGNESAVLLGDYLLSRAFRMCADLEPEVTRVVAATAGRTCEGELRQINQRENWGLSESEYIDIITEKSAAFFSSCCYLGAVLAGGSETQARSLADFGLNVGIAFQITDDLLDIIGEESEAGKTLGTDVEKSKLTLAVIHLLNSAEKTARGAVMDALGARCGAYGAEGKRRYDQRALAELLRSSGSLAYARGRAEEYVMVAIEAWASLKESAAKDALKETARFVVARAAEGRR